MPEDRTRRLDLPGGTKHRFSDRDICGDSRSDRVRTITDDGWGPDGGVDRDVTTEAISIARRLAEQEAAFGAAEEADLMKSVLLSTVCHELRTPLTTIKGLTNVLLDYEDRLEKPEKRELLAGIDEASDRLAAMIDSLLAFARLDAGMLPMQLAPTRVDEVVRSAVAQLGLRADERHISLEVPPELPMAMVDADGLCQVLDNLLANALKYTPAETSIRVECSEVTYDGESALRVRVQDEGPGIPEDQLEAIFQPFYQLDHRVPRHAGGVGLGLAICRQIVDAHGGRLWAESVQGRGVAFVVTLPVASPLTYYHPVGGGEVGHRSPSSPLKPTETPLARAPRQCSSRCQSDPAT